MAVSTSLKCFLAVLVLIMGTLTTCSVSGYSSGYSSSASATSQSVKGTFRPGAWRLRVARQPCGQIMKIIFIKGTMITRSMSEIMLRRVGLQTVTALLSRAQSQKRVEEQSEERNQFRPDSTQLYIRGWLKSRVLNKS